jgi:surfeit locus 1 family protein
MRDIRRHFRFRPGPILAVLSAVLLLAGLGTWQMQRMSWKDGLNAELAARRSQPPAALPETLSDPDALAFTPVRLSGHFLHDRELYLGARVHRGEAGFGIVTPFVLADGRTVLVERGWVPSSRRMPETRAAGQIPGDVTIEGHVRTGGWTGYKMFRPANRPADNDWLWMDLPAMAAHVGVDGAVTSLYIVAGAGETPGGLPIGDLRPVEVRNSHLGYAMTWYALAVALLVMYVVHQSRPREEEG